jgi:predicted naringenin-chalcone synthase
MTTPKARIHAIGTAVPDHDIHNRFIQWAGERLTDKRERKLFDRMAARSGIEHRWSVLPRAQDGGSPVEPGGFYDGGFLPSTGRRMEVYAQKAPDLALAAIAALADKTSLDGITHLVVASCTGFVAPGIDQIIIRRLGLSPTIERTMVGFMGCYAAVAALRVAHHIARSDADARVLVVTVELSTLHLSRRQDLESLLAALQFADGAAAAVVSAEPQGLEMEDFFCATLPETDELIQWTIGDEGFEMVLSGEVPGRIGAALHEPETRTAIMNGYAAEDVEWAVHPGGRSILDAVEHGLGLGQGALAASRSVLARFGNMSSATLMFVLSDLMERPGGTKGVAIAFGPGLAAEGFRYSRP